MPEQLRVGELDARATRRGRRTGSRGRPSAGGVVEPLGRPRRRAGPWPPRSVTRWAAYGATSAGQTMPFSSWWASTMQATLRPSPIPYEPMTIGWRLAVLAEVGRAERRRVKSVPSLKMLPTSMPVARGSTGMPHFGQGSPSRAFVMSATWSGVKSRPTLTLRRWKPVPVRAGDEVRRAGDELVDDDDRVARADRRAVAGLHARAP